jgi:hypothetical protein
MAPTMSRTSLLMTWESLVTIPGSGVENGPFHTSDGLQTLMKYENSLGWVNVHIP